MNTNTTIFRFCVIAGISVVLAVTGCKKYVPQERETVGPDSQFTIDTYQPVLGRTTFYVDNFYKGSTTFPADFKIVNPRRRSGEPAPELTDVFPVKVWKVAYTGEERSLAEIEAKRQLQYRPLLEVSPHSGNFTLWAEARSSFMRPQPDSGYLFDVELSNSGGRRYFRNLKLMPYRERPYEPSNYNPISGQPMSNGIYPATVSNMKGAGKNRYLSRTDVDVYIRKLVVANPTNSITFRFLDTLYNPIDPAKFATTEWGRLLHGFDREMTNSYVKYKVAFPVPLAEIPTPYTSPDGKRARVSFGYSRLGFGGLREDALLQLEFALYEPGEWEIVFAFKYDNPKFAND